MNRQTFLKHSLLATGATLFAARASAAEPIAADFGRGPGKGPRADLKEVYEFVQAGHRDLPKVKSMLAANPALANARWDWGDGDWESALEGAAHIGQPEIVRHLLENGARADAFSAAMLGETAVVTAMVKLTPSTANTRGPHGIPLMHYVGLGGSATMAAAVRPHLATPTPDCNRALYPAAAGGHTQLVEWLLANGADDVNAPNVFGDTPLDGALAGNHADTAALLRENGGQVSR